MAKIDLDKVAKNLAGLIPEFKMKFIRPMERYAKNTVSPLLVYAMAVLSHKTTATMTELSNMMKISKQQLTPIIDRLINMGYASRCHDEQDRRSINIFLTEKGNAYLDELKNEMIHVTKNTISALTDEDLTILDNALNDIYRVIGKLK